jgi:hypothetical protein
LDDEGVRPPGDTDLPDLAPPPELDVRILAAIATIPQDVPGPAVVDLPQPPAPANRSPRWWWGAALAAAALAAAALLTIAALPPADPVGNPQDWTARGDQGAGPGVDLRLAVRRGPAANEPGAIERFRRDTRYLGGDTLLFRYDAHADGWLALVRVTSTGAEVVHTQAVAAGSGELVTTGGLVGYELESGETASVFALIRADHPIDEAALVAGLSVPAGADAQAAADAVCAAALALGARCAAESLGEVP